MYKYQGRDRKYSKARQYRALKVIQKYLVTGLQKGRLMRYLKKIKGDDDKNAQTDARK